MSNRGETPDIRTEYSISGVASSVIQNTVGNADPRVPLLNLSTIRSRMDSLQRFLSESVNGNTLITKHQMAMVSSEITSAIHQIIVNGASLLSCSQQPVPPLPSSAPDTNFQPENPVSSAKRVETDCEIVELDAVELLAEHVHFCKICGKGFKRDANLRMHMRAHGNQYKTPEALAKPDNGNVDNFARKTRFSCPYEGCNRNRKHNRFRPLKSVICVRNHFRRSHCPKMYSCNRCRKKSFSVVADLKSHLKHCGEARWRCSCGTSFSRKDKLFGHIALFEGHMPAVFAAEGEEEKGLVAMEEDDGEGEEALGSIGGVAKGEGFGASGSDDGFFEGLLDEFDSIESYFLQDVL